MSAKNSHMVELRDVKMQFEDKKVLDGFSLAVEPEDRLVIMGQSGSGKSTILRLILGMLQPYLECELKLHVTKLNCLFSLARLTDRNTLTA